MNGGRIALVHDYWVTLRGGERVFLALSRLFPEADCYALVTRPGAMPPSVAPPPVRASLLRHVPQAGRHHRALLPLYPLAARSLDLRGYDLVVSSTSGFCHGVRTDGVHVSYCHTPFRYAWNEYEATLAAQPSAVRRAALATLLGAIRRADVAAARRVTAYIANSTEVRARIAAYYGRQSTVVHPFVETERFQPIAGAGSYFLVVAQLLPYKRVDLAVQACTRLRLPLVVVGEGPERTRLQAMAGPTVRFVSRVSEEELPRLYAECLALLQCGEEDFGIAALEAQAAGRPVLAYGSGGALETVDAGVTGDHFAQQTLECLLEALADFTPGAYDRQAIRAHAEHFDEAHFRAAMVRAIARTGVPVAPRRG